MRLPALAASLAALSIACSAAPADDAASSDSAQTSIKALSVVKGREWARCWMQQSALVCQSTKRAENDPLVTTVKAFGLTGGAIFSKDIDEEQGGVVAVASIAAYPTTLTLSAELPRSARDAIGIKDLSLQTSVTLTSANQYTQASPLVFTQPFDLWPTGLIGDADRSSFAVNATYDVPLAPLTGFLDNTSSTAEVSFFSNAYRGQLRYWIAPKQGAITITDGSIPKPGYYTMTRAGLRASTPEEVLRDFPNAGESTPDPVVEDAGPAPDASPTPDVPVVDAGPPDPTPGCGGNNQAPCVDNFGNKSCDPATRLDYGVNKCVSCGANGQTFCVDNFGNKMCNAGTRLDYGVNQCVACGNAGQTYCSDNLGNKICNAGLRFDYGTNKCVAQ